MQIFLPIYDIDRDVKNCNETLKGILYKEKEEFNKLEISKRASEFLFGNSNYGFDLLKDTSLVETRNSCGSLTNLGAMIVRLTTQDNLDENTRETFEKVIIKFLSYVNKLDDPAKLRIINYYINGPIKVSENLNINEEFMTIGSYIKDTLFEKYKDNKIIEEFCDKFMNPKNKHKSLLYVYTTEEFRERCGKIRLESLKTATGEITEQLFKEEGIIITD